MKILTNCYSILIEFLVNHILNKSSVRDLKANELSQSDNHSDESYLNPRH